MRRPASAVLLLLVAGTLLGGCDRNPLKAGAAALADAEATQAQQQRNAKVNAYVSCYNYMDQDVQKGMAQYTHWMRDPQAGPQGDEPAAYGPGYVPKLGLDQCAGPVDRVLAADPKLPALDTAVVAFREAAQALAPLADEATRYYGDKAYARDGFAQGKRMHAPLLAAMQAYADASTALSTQLEAQIAEGQRAEIADLEKREGRSLQFYRLSLMVDSKVLVDRVAEEHFDLEAAERDLKTLDTLAAEAHANVKQDGDMQLRWSNFESALNDVSRTARARIDRQRAHQPYTADEQRELDRPASNTSLHPRGSARAVLYAYNYLVEHANRM